MKVFISHSSADRDAADAFVKLLRDALGGLRAGDIRCTSVEGYGLPAGTAFETQLRREISEAESLVALLTPACLRSTYVLFELGARWETGHPLLAVRMGGLRPESLKGPLSTIITADGSRESEVADLMSTLSKNLGLELERFSAYSDALKEFVALSLSAAHKRPTGAEPADDGDERPSPNVAFILSPKEMAVVSQRLPVSGQTNRLDADLRLWLVVETPNGELYPQYALTRSLGGWSQHVHIGRVGAGKDTGCEYVVMLVAAGAEANYYFEKYVRGDSDSKDGFGRVHPVDMLILDSRRVVRGD